jgi:adenylate cyclase
MIDRILDLRVTATGSGDVLAGVCNLLREQGVPVDRGSLHARHLHPQFMGRTLYWSPEDEDVTEIGRVHGVQLTDTYLNSPLAEIDSNGQSLRRRLRNLDRTAAYPVLLELAAEGFVDYVMLPLERGQGPRLGLSIATRRPEGFSDGQIVLVERAIPALSAVFELFEQRHTASLLLETYIGRGSGRRVLEGTIRRGEGECVHAIILSTDMRGFTYLSQRQPLPTTIDMLNRYFDAVGAPIEAYGGEILKFIGDEILAIFPCHTTQEETCDTADRALRAARSIFTELGDTNRTLTGEGLPSIDASVAVHIGHVMYGNVGTASRLDFTAVGPAVNMVARLRDLASRLGERMVVSADLASLADGPFRSLGCHDLKGISEPQEAFGVDDFFLKARPPAA